MFNFDSLLPAGVYLQDYQTCGVATALLERRLILGDEMGLGKSAQALVAIEAADAYPAVISCPASLKANWANEIAKFLPRRGAFIAGGRPSWWEGDFVIVSYSSLHNWVGAFSELGAVVLDESHYCSDLTRRRSQAALGLTQLVRPSGLVMALTGTPFVNKPQELISQLRLVGQLQNACPKPEVGNDWRAWAKSFKDEWCRDVGTLRQLHRILCQTCYVRRQRKDVLGRNETKRSVVKLSLELGEYREAEADLIAYLAERDGTEAAARAMNAQGLARLANLRRLVGEAKVWAARQWIDSFLHSNPDRSLVVFAYHQAVQRALVERYQCAHILGGERDVEEQKARFQSGQSRLIVCSLTAGREGHTLTKASDVLFVELGWAPGGHDQAEARVNRMGQPAEATFAWYLLGAGTVDEKVWGILGQKRQLFAAAAEGRASAHGSEQATAMEVLGSYRRYRPGPVLGHAPRPKVVPFRRDKN